MALERAISVLEIATPIAEAIPVLGTPVKGALEATTKILKYAGDVKSNKEKVKELAEHSTSWLRTIVDTLHGKRDDPGELERLRGQVDGIVRVLTAIEESTARQARQSTLQRIVNKSADLDDLTSLRERLHDAYNKFMLASQMRIEQTVTTVLSLADLDTLKSLKPVPEARYDSLVSPSGCLKDTRTEVLERMLLWAKQDTAKFCIYWLAGLAGTGKSTIAKSFCEQLVKQGDALVATFFASKSSADRRDPLRALYTFAYELAYTSPMLRAAILRAVRSHPDVKQRPLAEQVAALLAQPFANSQEASRSTSHPLILVIDALDEFDEIYDISAANFIRVLAIAFREMPVRLVVTSRRDSSLQEMFESLPNTNIQLLHDVEAVQIAGDLHRIFMAGFSDIAARHRLQIAETPWPSMDQIAALTDSAGQLFIYASTVLKYVGDRRFSPPSRLRQILDGEKTSGPHSSFAPLDSLYMNILLVASQDEANDVNPQLYTRLRSLVGTLALLQEPLHIAALAGLMEMETNIVRMDVLALSAVLLTDALEKTDMASTSVHIFHPSFRDFLLERCADNRFHIDGTQQHRELALRCLKVLNETLKRDICGIQNPTVANSDVKGPPLSIRLRTYVSEAATYSARFWLVHFALSGELDQALAFELRLFVTKNVIHWIELMSLLAQLPQAFVTLRRGISHLQTCSISSDGNDALVILTVLDDTLRCMLSYQQVIKNHALQVYYSMLVTMPNSLLLRMSPIYADLPCLRVTRPQNDYGPLLVMEGHTAGIHSVAFSPDGTRIVSSSVDNTVRIWDAYTGREIVAFNGKGTSVFSAIFSPDGHSVLWGTSHGPLQLRDAATLTIELGFFSGHEKAVKSCQFSPDARQIASGSLDHTIRLWDVGSVRPIAILRGHSEEVICVAYSLDGVRLVSSACDFTIRIWNTSTRDHTVLVDTSESLVKLRSANQVAFSPDGTRIIEDSDLSLRIWNIATKTRIKLIRQELFMAISPNGCWIASTCWNNSDYCIRLRNADTGELVMTYLGHRSPVRCVSFSLDSLWVISGSVDKIVRLWEVKISLGMGDVDDGERSKYVKNKLPEFKNSVSCLDFSPNGEWVIVGTSGMNLCLNSLDMCHVSTYTNSCILDNSEDLTLGFHGVAFSPDGKRIVSSVGDGSLRMWDVETKQQLVQTPPRRLHHMTAVTFMHHGTAIISGSTDGIIQIWDSQTLREVHAFDLQPRGIHKIACSPDSLWIVSCSNKNNFDCDTWNSESVWVDSSDIQVWSATGDRIATLDSLEGHLTFIKIDNSRRVTARRAEDESWISWDLIHDELDSCGKLIPVFPQEVAPPTGLGWQQSRGWITYCTGTRNTLDLCWIPADLRGTYYAVHGAQIAVGSDLGKCTIIDFGGMLAMLKEIEIIQD